MPAEWGAPPPLPAASPPLPLLPLPVHGKLPFTVACQHNLMAAAFTLSALSLLIPLHLFPLWLLPVSLPLSLPLLSQCIKSSFLFSALAFPSSGKQAKIFINRFGSLLMFSIFYAMRLGRGNGNMFFMALPFCMH